MHLVSIQFYCWNPLTTAAQFTVFLWWIIIRREGDICHRTWVTLRGTTVGRNDVWYKDGGKCWFLAPVRDSRSGRTLSTHDYRHPLYYSRVFSYQLLLYLPSKSIWLVFLQNLQKILLQILSRPTPKWVPLFPAKTDSSKIEDGRRQQLFAIN